MITTVVFQIGHLRAHRLGSRPPRNDGSGTVPRRRLRAKRQQKFACRRLGYRVELSAGLLDGNA